MSDLRSALGNIFPSDRILDSRLLREIYGRDASYFNIIPQAIVRPQSAAEVERLLALARGMGFGVTFRTGGTSLSGQTLGEGVICELRNALHGYEIHDGGKRIWFEPSLTAAQINAYLKPYGRKIGPDPGSVCAAMMGGILANNSSGMEAGVKYNSYNTLRSLEFILPDGKRYDSADAADRRRFTEEQREICRGLLQIREEIMKDGDMFHKIKTKYKIKNVTGYGMNSFIDFSDPLDILIHLIIGSEGTLAYIVSGELRTVPIYSRYTSAMLYFDTVTAAGGAAEWLGDSGALAVEMMDYASLRSYMGETIDLPKGATALLIDYGADSSEELDDTVHRLTPAIQSLRGVVKLDSFTRTVAERAALWQMRSGIFPCVAGARVPGATVILEDVASPVADLERLVGGVQQLFAKYGYSGAIFGHARDGNIHPLLTSPVETPEQLDTFRRFMDDLVEHVVKLNGSLKGEHGTGRAIAPFVEKEWGPEIYALMKRVKKLIDPQGILNPGVIINSDPDCFIKPMKRLDLFGKQLGYPHADLCMECGYCEHVCPTRDITLTPRQRLQARRIINGAGSDAEREGYLKEYRFLGEESCCSDGSCQIPCPMSISTAEVTDGVRVETYGKAFKKSLTYGAKHYKGVEKSVRGALRAAVIAEKVVSPYPLEWGSALLHRMWGQVPHWSRHFPMPIKFRPRPLDNPDYIYFPACVTRIFGASSLGKDDQVTVMLRIADKVGIRLSLPDVGGLCCSQIWEHKGDPAGKAFMANKIIDAFYEMSRQGSIPIVCDTTSCTHTLLTDMEESLTGENKKKYAALRIIDICQWLDDVVMPRAHVVRKKKLVLLHPTCASRIIGMAGMLEHVARQCAEEVVVPVNTQCCGAAGDRGFIYPQVAKSATAPEKAETAGEDFDGCYSLARTCEISMMDSIGRPYESIVYLVDETITTRATDK